MDQIPQGCIINKCAVQCSAENYSLTFSICYATAKTIITAVQIIESLARHYNITLQCSIQLSSDERVLFSVQCSHRKAARQIHL